MPGSLEDQLLKAGLVDKKRAHKARTEKRASKRKQGRAAADTVPGGEAHASVQQARAEKAARDRALNQQREAERLGREREAQLRQLVMSRRLGRDGAELPYQFAQDGVIRRIHVTAAMRARIVSGQLAVVTLDDTFEVVPAEVARTLREHDPGRVLTELEPPRDGPPAEGETNDPYASYVVPDDLTW